MKLPQLSLRDLFWLVLVCALMAGWWRERARANTADVSQLEQKRVADLWRDHAMTLAKALTEDGPRSVMLRDEHGNEVKFGPPMPADVLLGRPHSVLRS